MTQTTFDDASRSDNDRTSVYSRSCAESVRGDQTCSGLTREGASRILPRRIDAKISPETASGCWLWTGYIDRAGYGQVRHNGKISTPHRAVYEILRGPVTAEDVDHLCRVRHCVNPAHLEPVTHRENMRRGNARAGINARKTHCHRGHEFTAENTIATKAGNRNCRQCLRDRRAARRVEVAS